jgi:hypothetical protein
LLFPRSRLAEGTSKYSGVSSIRAVKSGAVVTVTDAFDRDSHGPAVVFHLDSQLHPTAVTLADNFYQQYRALGRPGALNQADLDGLLLVRNLARPSPM